MDRNIIRRTASAGLGLLFSWLGVAAAASAATAPRVGPAQVLAWQDAGTPLLVIDTRSPHRFEEKRIRGAISIPAFAVAMKPLPAEMKVVLYDDGAGATEADGAAAALQAKGHKDVHVLDGGLTTWEGERLPVVARPGAAPIPLVEPVSVEQLQKLVDDGARPHIIDVSPAAAFKRNHVPGARSAASAPLLDQAAASLRPHDLIVVCDDGSGEALRKAEQLRRRGFRAVKYLYGGMLAWEAKRLEQAKSSEKVGE